MNFSSLNGKIITAIIGCQRGSEEIRFTLSDETEFRMHHHQSCCESVSVEDVVGDVEDLIGSPILLAQERSNGADETKWGNEQWTFYEIATNRGSMTIRWYGSSNGYYSTSVAFDAVDLHDHARSGTLTDGVYEVETADGREWWLWDQEHWRDFAGVVLNTWEASNRFTVLGPALKRS